jgi:hypothetical protein
MSATLFKKVDYSLSKLIHDIEHGDITLTLGYQIFNAPLFGPLLKFQDY